MQNLPKRIYLQVGEEVEGTENFDELCRYGEVTWWKERMFKSDIEYQHTDELDRLREQNAELREALKNLLDFPENDLEAWEYSGATITLTGWHIKQARAALAKYENSPASQDAGQH